MRVLHSEMAAAGIEITESVYGNTWRLSRSLPEWRPEAFEQADLIVVNGEGTMHDDSIMATFLLDEVMARRGDRRLAHVNSLWQNMSPRHAGTLAGADLVCVREPASHAALGLRTAVVMPDLSCYLRPPRSSLPDQGLLKGTFYGPVFRKLELDGGIDVEREDWSVMVNKLRHARALLTGKHHEVMAACVARCPFVTVPLATHKIAGLGGYAGAELPQVRPGCGPRAARDALEQAAADRDGAYARLFDRLDEMCATIRLRDLLAGLG